MAGSQNSLVRLHAADWLAGGGEMGELIRSYDWAKTPLGPVESWPQSLRSAISILLPSKAQIAIFWGPDLITLYNDAYRPVLGKKHPRALGLPVREVWSELWDVGLKNLFESVLTTGEAFWASDYPFYMERYGFPEETFFDISYDPIRDESGKVGGLFCIVNDTTARVVGERRLKTLRDLSLSAAAETKSVEEACRAVAEILSRYRHDLPFALLYLLDSNDTHAHLVGASGLSGGTSAAPLDVDLSNPNAENVAWPLSSVLRSNRSEEVTDVISRLGELPGGAWPESPHTAIVIPIKASGQDRATGFLVAGVSPRRPLDDQYRAFLDLLTTQIATTISNARAYEEEKRRAEALAELDRAKTTFFSNVSHEFRTPLTLMLGPVTDLLGNKDGFLQDSQRERLEIAHRNGLRLQKLVNTLLDFSRIEAGRVHASYQPTELGSFTKDLASNFRSACEKAGLEFVVDCPVMAEPVYLDPDMWEKIVLNLISNAFKFTLSGKIEVTVRQVGDHAELAVRDTGIGIPPEELPRLFERFHRVEVSRGRTQEGSGIGLAFVRELAKLHGGSVRAESTLGIGSTFIVSIPLGKSHLPPNSIRSEPVISPAGVEAAAFVGEALRWLPDSPANTSDQEATLVEGVVAVKALRENIRAKTSRILLADDNADMRDYVHRLLGDRHEVRTVTDGQAALDAIQEFVPDLILSDIMMPVLDGFELLARVRSDPRTREIPVILLSARAGEESRIEGLEATADEYLIKPFSARELLATVEAHLKMMEIRRNGQEALRDNEERLRGIFNQTLAGIAQTDLTGRFVNVNERYCEIVGRTADELFNLTMYDVTHPDDLQQNLALFEPLLDGNGEPFVIEKRYRRPDNTDVWVSNSVSLVRDPRGRPQYTVAVSLDISDRKNAEQALAIQSERSRLLWEAAAVLLTTDDPHTMLRGLFEKIRGSLGLDVYFNFMVNEPGDALQLVSCAGISEDIARSISQLGFGQAICGTVALRGLPIVATYIQASLDPMVQLVKGFGVRAYACNPLIAGGRLLGTLSFASRTRDFFKPEETEFLETITHYVTVAYERLRMIKQLREQDQRKDEFLATLAHELRNPLAPIRNGLELINLSKTDPDRLVQATMMMQRQVEQMVRLVDDLLDVSRISRNKLELRKVAVELDSIVRSAVETSRPLIETAKHELRVTLPLTPIVLEADPVRLAQAISNLLNNAAKYSEPGSQIWLTAEEADGYLILKVRDTGIGIEPKKLPQIFDMFVQLDTSEQLAQGGLGVGLTLVRRLIEMHGGRVEAYSDGIGKGSEFVIRLPITRLSMPETLPLSNEQSVARPQVRRRILVVDDNHDSAESMAMMLELSGHEVVMAHDGVEAIEMAESFKPDFAFLDLGMPKLDGYEAARSIRLQPGGEQIMLVALTGWGQEEDKRRTKEAGFNAHMVKPIDFAALEKLLND